MSKELKVLNKTLPCNTCNAGCCGSFPLGTRDFATIFAYLKTLPIDEVKRLADQKREDFDCCFLDKETFRCGVYPARPLVCDLYGHAPSLTCDYLPESTGKMTDAEMALTMTLNVMDQEYCCHSGGTHVANMVKAIHSKVYSEDHPLMKSQLPPSIDGPKPLLWSELLSRLYPSP
jgi:uncharacterized protein